jgi:hypothetical protein
LATSDSRAHAEASQTLGAESDNQASQAPRIPSEKPYPEVSEVMGGGESCSAETAEQGGAAGPGHVNLGATGLDKSASEPVVARLDHGYVVKSVGVASHPAIMRAHQLGSVTQADHKAAHGAVKCPAPMAKPVSSESPVAATASSEGSTMPAQKADKPTTVNPNGQRNQASKATTATFGTLRQGLTVNGQLI